MSFKSRNFAFLVYPESAPSDWLPRLRSSFEQYAISPCHNKDVNSDGSLKKAHFHCMIHFKNARSDRTVLQDLNAIFGCEYFHHLENVRNAEAYYTYLFHGDSDDKASYKESDIILLNGYVPPLSKALKEAHKDEEVTSSLMEILSIIDEFHIKNFRSLIFHCFQMERFDLVSFVKSNAYLTVHLF